ncbi:DNA-binding protein [Modicisalibacter zincidurans]|uniref:KfrA N-terminal DNA-binding domain-containing protein n=1 Tax=Modicisalibacter zincidurans TaxID=1178777 RepID=A0ABP9RJF2_9GAMM|nr:DNA-binding protein [Halomonas zincidurans]
MARSGVQFEDVQRAIDVLLKRGEAPGIQKIRDVLGTGSFTTISEHFREWREQRDANRDQPTWQDIPEPVETLVHSLWEQAQQHASDGLSHYREEADRLVEEAREQAQRSRREAEDALQREAAINEHWLQAQARLQEHSALIARLEAVQQAAEQRENELNQRLAAAERQAGEARQSLRDEQAQHQTALKARDEYWSEQLKQEEQRHEAAEARLMALLDEARQERQRSEKNQQQRIDALEKRLAEADKDRQATRRALNEEQASHRETQWSLNKAEDALSESERRVRQYADDRAENDKVVAQLRERLQDAEARLARVNLPPFVY